MDLSGLSLARTLETDSTSKCKSLIDMFCEGCIGFCNGKVAVFSADTEMVEKMRQPAVCGTTPANFGDTTTTFDLWAIRRCRRRAL